MIRTLLILFIVAFCAGCEAPDAEGRTDANVAEKSTELEPAQTMPRTGVPPRDAAMAPMIVIADLHGDIDPLRNLLRETGLAAGDTWTGGDRTLVQTGDVLDRGDDEKEIYQLLWKLQKEAAEAGGNVVLMNGNHEVMNVMGDLRYVTPGGAVDFADHELPDEPRFANVPDAMRGRLAAFLPGGPWAEKLADQPVIAKVEGRLFAHGGVHLPHVEYGIEKINAEMSEWMRQGGAPPKWATAQDGPLWTRAWSGDDSPDCDRLRKMLEAADASMLAVGHTPQRAGAQSRCDGKLWLIDTGMAEHYGGPTQAIGIFEDGGVSIVRPADLQ